jgi:hypothetical protein
MATVKQDLPPSGGYRPINFARNPAKSFFKGILFIVILAKYNHFVLLNNLEVESWGNAMAHTNYIVHYIYIWFYRQVDLYLVDSYF